MNFYATVLLFTLSVAADELDQCRLNDPTKCLCFPDYEYQCPPDTNQVLIHAKPHEYLQIDCGNLQKYDLSILPNMTLGRIEDFKFRFCPLPEDSFLATLRRFNVTGVKNVALEDVRSDINITKELFVGLDTVETLEIQLVRCSFEDDFLEYLSNISILYLDNNNIRELRDMFKYTPKLIVLHLSRNGIVNIPDRYFSNLQNLKQLHLWSNKLVTLNATSFAGLSELRSLELSRNDITTLDENTFKDLINLVDISLRSNKLRNVPANIFAHNQMLEGVRMGDNSQLQLPNRLFADLKKLTRVDIDRSNIDQLPEQLFDGSENIKSISFKDNKITTLPKSTFATQKKLQKLNLSTNRIQSLPDDVFSTLRNLEELDLSNNRITSLSKTVFKNLENLGTLNLKNNRISEVHPGAFDDLAKIVTLDVSHNLYTMDYPTALDAFHPFTMCEKLEVLQLDHNKIRQFPDELLYTMSLRKIDLSHNEIENVNVISLRKLKTHRVEIDLSNNRIHYLDFTNIKLLSNFDDYDAAHTYGDFSTRVNLTGNPIWCNCSNFDLVMYANKEINPIVPTLVDLHLDDLMCAEPEDLRHISVAQLKPWQISCPFRWGGCPAECDCFEKPYDKAVVVECDHRNLTEYPPLTGLDKWLQKGNVMDVNLNDNMLSVGPNASSGYNHVRNMLLSNNRIKKLEWVPPNVQVLTLDNNALQTVGHDALTLLKNDSALSKLTLSDNPWTCGCSNVDLQVFLKTNFVKVNSSSVLCSGTSDLLIKQELCKPTGTIAMQIALPILVFLLLSAVAAVVYYKYTHEVKVWLFSKNLCLWFVTEQELDKDKIYDIFISYSHKDEDFVVQNLLPVLESGPDPFKVCIHVRDWVPGEYISTQVVNSVLNSRRTLVILSNNFLESIWGKLEFRTAHMSAIKEGRARVIAVKYGELNEDKLDADLKAYLKTNTYVEWGKPWFWNKLRYALPHRTDGGALRSQRHLTVMLKIDDKFDMTDVGHPPTSTPPAMTLDAGLLKHHPLNLMINEKTIQPPMETPLIRRQ